MPLKRFTPGCCCDSPGGGDWECGLFSDYFDRPDSADVGNGWGDTEGFYISENRLNGTSGDMFAPFAGRTNMSISSVIQFRDTPQTAKIYYGGPGNYVAITNDNSDATKRHFYLVYGGVIRDRTNVNGGFPFIQQHAINVCITATQIVAFANGQRVVYAPPGSLIISGAVGVGVEGNVGNGPVVFRNFLVDIVGGDSDFCYNCSPDACAECSYPNQWMVDLSAFNGQMLSAINPFPDTDPAPPFGYGPEVECGACVTGWGQFILDPFSSGSNGTCQWRYDEEFCSGYFLGNPNCDPLQLSIILEAVYPYALSPETPPCQINVGIRLFQSPTGGGTYPCGESSQTINYTGSPHDADTTGRGVATLFKNHTGLNAGYFVNGNIALPTGAPVCVKDIIVTSTGSGGQPATWVYEYYFPPEEITVTRL